MIVIRNAGHYFMPRSLREGFGLSSTPALPGWKVANAGQTSDIPKVGLTE